METRNPLTDGFTARDIIRSSGESLIESEHLVVIMYQCTLICFLILMVGLWLCRKMYLFHRNYIPNIPG